MKRSDEKRKRQPKKEKIIIKAKCKLHANKTFFTVAEFAADAAAAVNGSAGDSENEWSVKIAQKFHSSVKGEFVV